MADSSKTTESVNQNNKRPREEDSEQPESKLKVAEITENNGAVAENKKRTRENEPESKIAKIAEDDADEEEEEDPDHFIHWRWLTVDALKTCVTWSEPKAIPKKCSVVWMNFNFDKFKKLCPDHPPVMPRQRKLFYTLPYLKTPFGYSPHMAANGIANNLRLTFADFLETESAEFYERAKEWDQWFIDEIFAHKDSWPLKIKLEKGEELTRSDVCKKYLGICRTPVDENGNFLEDFPQYMGAKFNTDRGDPKKRPPIPADPYTAYVKVWNNQKELVTEIMHVENAVPTKEEIEENPNIEAGRNIFVNKNDYVQGIFHMQKLYFAGNFGPTVMVDEIMYDTEQNLKSKKESKKTCPF